MDVYECVLAMLSLVYVNCITSSVLHSERNMYCVVHPDLLRHQHLQNYRLVGHQLFAKVC